MCEMVVSTMDKHDWLFWMKFCLNGVGNVYDVQNAAISPINSGDYEFCVVLVTEKCQENL